MVTSSDERNFCFFGVLATGQNIRTCSLTFIINGTFEIHNILCNICTKGKLLLSLHNMKHYFGYNLGSISSI